MYYLGKVNLVLLLNIGVIVYLQKPCVSSNKSWSKLFLEWTHDIYIYGHHGHCGIAVKKWSVLSPRSAIH